MVVIVSHLEQTPSLLVIVLKGLFLVVVTIVYYRIDTI